VKTGRFGGPFFVGAWSLVGYRVMKLDRTQRRILGALIEKRFTTPDLYPLTFKALLAACNQKSNRDPVLTLNDFEIEGTLFSLKEGMLVEEAARDGGYAARYRERLCEQLALDRSMAALLAELMLRGPQTEPELFRRAARMAPFASADAVRTVLDELAGRLLVELLPRASGRRHPRWRHLLAAEEPEQPSTPEGPAGDDRDTVHRFYRARAAGDRESWRALLDGELPLEGLGNGGIERMEYEYEVYGAGEAIVSYRISARHGARRVIEHLVLRGSRIAAIHRLSNQALDLAKDA